MTELPTFNKLDIQHFPDRLQQKLEDNRQAIAQRLQQSSFVWKNLIQPLDNLSGELDQMWSPLVHLHHVKDSPAVRAAYEACLPMLSAYETELGQHKGLYQAIKALSESADYQQYDTAQKTVLAHHLRDFHLAGVDLPQEKQDQYRDIVEKLAKLNAAFSDHVLDATQAWSWLITDEKPLSGLPEHTRQAAREKAQEQHQEGWLLTLDFPCYFSVMTYADDAHVRETLYHAYITRASELGPDAGKFDNSSIMQDIVDLRQQLAEVLGFANYAELSLVRKMAASPQEVMDFLLDLVDRCRQQAQREFQALQQFAAKHCQQTRLQPWDIGYYSEKMCQHDYGIDQEMLRPYFPEGKVIEGLFAIIKKLYQVTVEAVDKVEVWHPDVKVFALFDKDGTCLGYLYMDLYARKNKRGGAWMDECLPRRRLDDGSLQLPAAYLNCNLTPPSGGKSAQFSHDEVVTLFHECGHCLHHLLTEIDYLDVAGINGVCWDAVELPSQFFEYWCWQKPALDLLSEHVDHKTPLPQTLIDKLQAAKNFQSAMQLMRQLEFALFDFRLHHDKAVKTSEDIQALLNEVRAKVAVVPTAQDNRFQHSFTHIFSGGYAAGYYSYLWAEVLAADAFSLFEERGVFDQATGAAFRQHILAKGGAEPALTLFINFRGRQPDIQALLRHRGVLCDAKRTSTQGAAGGGG